MARLVKFSLVFLTAAVLGACAQDSGSDDVVVIEEDPVYTKY